MEQINEQWRPIEGYEGLYEVSSLGKVKSLGNGMILRPILTKKGYLRVGLYIGGKRKMFMVHRLVAQSFIPNPQGLPQINHRDENPSNNIVDNLEWCDCKYNINYGTHNERMIQTRIRKGLADPELCGIWKKYKKEYYRLYMREYRLKKKKSSEESLW